MHKFATSFLGASAMVLMLSACGIIGPDYERPAMETPSLWPFGEASADQQQAQQAALKAGWWKSYNDPVLEGLITEGLKANADIEVAAARVAQARAAANLATANRFPLLSGQGGATRSQNSVNAFGGGGGAGGLALGGLGAPINVFSLAAVLDYEVDLWGRLSKLSESAQSRLLAASYNRDAVQLAIESDVAASYFNLRALDAQIAVTEQTIKAREDAYGIETKQFEAGATNGLTFRQAESELAVTRAQLPQLRQLREEQLTALGVLLGRTPKQITDAIVLRGNEIDALPVPPIAPPLVPGDLPSTLLERRPDIAAAEQQLSSSTAEIAAARALYFPTISLSGLIGASSISTGTLFDGDSRNWQLGANAAGPLLDFGRTSANVELAQGLNAEDLANYKQVVRGAFKDVRDALTAQTNTAERQEAETMRMKAQEETLRLSRLRYDAGYSSNLEVLDAQRGLYTAQVDRISAKLQRLIASVNLYKALGGGWSAGQEAK